MPLHLPGQSNEPLVRHVKQLVPRDHRDISAVPELDSGGPLRAVDMLLSLATATRPRYRSDVLDVHAQWALLRYIGVFDAVQGPPARFGLSDAGRRVIGNQRRVMSEELGIGFATLLAGHWLRPDSPLGRPNAEAVDIDLLLRDPDVYGVTAEKARSRRPDYLVVDRDESHGVRLGLLECKGTRTPGYAPKQLATASEQLAGIRLNGAELPGLAISSVVADKAIGYQAVQRSSPPVDEYGADPEHRRVRVPYDEVDFPGRDRGRLDDRIRIGSDDADLFSALIERPRRLSREEAGMLAGEVLVESWGVLSELSGNDEAMHRWRRSRGESAPTMRTDRRTVSGPGGTTILGVSETVALPGGQLEMILGVLDYVDDALMTGDEATVIAAQSRAGSELRNRDADARTDDSVAAYGGNGSALVLRAT